MAPFPAEIDLFTIPHSRMKELVNTYTEKVQCVDFRDCQETFTLLKELQATFYEFKSHECIENLFIMDQLKNRLKQRHIYNSAVCDCHNDNRLAKMLSLVKHGRQLLESSICERLNFGEELQKCFFDFVKEFLPHMEEEENIFQPLLVEHFEYDELRALKQAVIEQHELIRDPQYQEKAELDLPETDSVIKELRDIDCDVWSLTDLYPESLSDKITTTHDESQDVKPSSCEESFKSKIEDSSKETESVNLPSEILIKIFDLLTPPDRGRCAQVCSYWNEVIYTPLLWKKIYPIQWARGIWTWVDANLNYLLEDEAVMKNLGNESWKYDEDADIDESEDVLPTSHQMEYNLFSCIISYLLPKVGRRIEKLVLDAGKGITSRQIRQALILCPNVTYFSAAYTSFSYHTLKGFRNGNCLSKLRHLDLQGCTEVDDNCMYMLSECVGVSKRSRRNCKLQMCINNESAEQCTSPEYFCPYFTSYCTPDLRSNNVYSPYNCPYLESISGAPPGTDSEDSGSEEETEIEELSRSKSRLRHLNLSGCYEVTDQGLRYLTDEGVLQNIVYLNISSCFDISGLALSNIVRQCRYLQPQNLSYCDNILNGPYSSLSNGCDNLSHPIKSCCQARMQL